MGQKKTIFAGSLGFLLLLLGVGLLFSFPAILSYLLGKRLPLLNNSTIFPIWKDIPMPMFFKVYFFNVTNADDIVNHSAEPQLQELGPYTYRLWWNKTDIRWNENATISFREVQRFFFEPGMSSGTEDDNITSLNAPMVIAGGLSKDSPMWMRVLVSSMISVLRERLFTQKKVRDLMFKGYPDFLIAVGRILHRDLPNTNGRFAWFYGKNATDDGLFTSFTGEDNLDLLNVIDRWKGEKDLPWWKDWGGCSKINGSNAEVSPPISEQRKQIQFFRSDLCRSWTLDYDKQVKYYQLDSRRFVGKASLLANSSSYPENACFETEKEMASGVLDISTCQHGAPVILSYPHFYLGDPIYREGILGLKPNSTRHNFYLDVEPMSGITTGMAARFQVNLHLQKIPGFSQFNQVTDRVFPVFWQELVGEVTQELANELQDNLQRPILYFKIGSYCLVAVGVLILLICGSVVLCAKKRAAQVSDCPDDDPILRRVDDSLTSINSINNNNITKNGAAGHK